MGRRDIFGRSRKEIVIVLFCFVVIYFNPGHFTLIVGLLLRCHFHS